MKATEQSFHTILFIMLYMVVLTFKSVNETLACGHSNEQYFHVVLLLVLKSEDETKCSHSNKSC